MKALFYSLFFMAILICPQFSVAQTLTFSADDSPPPAQVAPAAGDDKYISVEAKGQGATKLEALNSAWSEAVRLGLGLYLDSKTEVIDDSIKEQIVAHSRGRVNSYQVLTREKVGGLWRVTISAEIEKDILQETAASSSTAAVKVDGSQVAATIVTGKQKKQSARDLIAAFGARFKAEDLFSLSLNLAPKDDVPVVTVTLGINKEKYQDIIVNDLVKVLTRVAVRKEEGIYSDSIIKANKKVAEKHICDHYYNHDPRQGCDWTLYHDSISDIYNRHPRDNQQNPLIFVGLDTMQFIAFEVEPEIFAQLKESTGGVCFNDEILHAAVREDVNVRISIKVYSDNEILHAAVREIYHMHGFWISSTPGHWAHIYPTIAKEGDYFDQYTFDIPLDIPAEDFAKVTELKGSFSIKN